MWFRRMSPPPTAPPSRSHWLLRHADQAGVAVLVLSGLAATIGWWLSQGGWQGRLVEVDRAGPQTAAFQVDINEADWPELAMLPGIGKTLAERIVASRREQGPFWITATCGGSAASVPRRSTAWPLSAAHARRRESSREMSGPSPLDPVFWG